jgi:hypothetical protein
MCILCRRLGRRWPQRQRGRNAVRGEPEWAAAQRSAGKERKADGVRQVLQSVLPVTQLRDELYAQV